VLKALIVDDEPNHRFGLAKHVNWNGLGYDSPLLAEDADEALFLTGNNRIDVLIADVCMPGMDGIELVKEMRVRYPDIHVLIISGYEEFEFARAAVEAGAKAYLLKPLKIEEVENWLKKFRNEIKMAEKLAKADLAMKKKLSKNLSIAQEKFLEDLLEDAYDEDTVIQRAELLDLPRDNFAFRLCLISIDDYRRLIEREPKTGPTLIYRLIKMVHTAFNTSFKIVVKKGLNSLVILLGENLVSVSFLESSFNVLKKSIEDKLGISVTICISSKGYGWEQVPAVYSECYRLLNAYQCYEKGQIILCEKAKYSEPYYKYDIEKVSEKAREYINEMDHENLNSLILRVFSHFISTKKCPLSLMQSLSLSVAGVLSQKFEAPGFQIAKSYTEYCRDIISCLTAEELRDVTLEAVADYFSAFENYKTRKKSDVIEQASKYIRENLQEDTTVKELADIVHMNASYLSVLFKKEMGITISEYVNNLRIEKAKRLLKQGYKVFDIARQVGYKNPSYFAYQFKKSVGLTPAEYRRYG